MSNTTYEQPSRYYYDQRAYPILWPAVCDRWDKPKKSYYLGVVKAMVRNAGQLPQPFWLGAAHGGGSCSAARCAART